MRKFHPTPAQASHGVPVVRVKLRASLDDNEELTHIYAWLDRWKNRISSCTRSGGVWDERFDIVAPHEAVNELPKTVVHAIEDPKRVLAS